jgi:hypothetical protein
MENEMVDLVTPVRDVLSRKITFKSNVLRNLCTMASHYHFDKKQTKLDDLLSIMIEELIEDYYDNKFLKELNNFGIDIRNT